MTEVEFLELKGIRKAYQLNKRFNLTVREMIEFLKEYSKIKLQERYVKKENLNDYEMILQNYD